MSALFSQFFSEIQAAFRCAEKSQPQTVRQVKLVGRTFALHFSGSALQTVIMPALAHLETTQELAVQPEVEFFLWDAVSTGIYPPKPPFNANEYHRFGLRAVADQENISVMYEPITGLLFVYHHQLRQGFFWAVDPQAISIYDQAAPLQTLFHWALIESGWHIVHTAAVGLAEGGVLLAGLTGAGKSSTALACLNHPSLRFLCDDKCLISLSPMPQAFGLYSSAKLKADMLTQLPHFSPSISGWDDTYKAGKSLIYLHPTYQAQMVTQFPIKAILLPRISHQQQPTLKAASPTDIFKVIGPSTIIWLPGAEADSFNFLKKLSSAVPCYWLDLALDLEKNIQAIVGALNSVQ